MAAEDLREAAEMHKKKCLEAMSSGAGRCNQLENMACMRKCAADLNRDARRAAASCVKWTYSPEVVQVQQVAAVAPDCGVQFGAHTINFDRSPEKGIAVI